MPFNFVVGSFIYAMFHFSNIKTRDETFQMVENFKFSRLSKFNILSFSDFIQIQSIKIITYTAHLLRMLDFYGNKFKPFKTMDNFSLSLCTINFLKVLNSW